MAAGVCLALMAGCAVGPTTGAGPASDMAPETVEAPVASRTVEIVDRDLVLHVGDERRTLASLVEEEGALVHAALRPGAHDEDTVVALTRVDDDAGDRYELRYLIATEDTVTDLYWFPWRLQVAEEVALILDVAPVPVWAPDGSAIAWIEWVDTGTRLRTVGWIDDGETRNPSDDASAYTLDDIPAGVQLEQWQVDAEGDPVLIGRRGDRTYRIRLALDVTGSGTAATVPG